MIYETREKNQLKNGIFDINTKTTNRLRNMRYEQSAKHQLNIEITIENIEINGFIILLHITGFTSHESFDLNNLLQPLKAM